MEEENKELNEVKVEEVASPTNGELEEPKEIEQEPKGKKKSIILVLVLLILALAGTLGYYFYSNMKPEPDKKTNTSESKEYSSGYRLSGNGLEDFDLYFLKIENEAKNKVYSPLSIKYALAMLYEGSDGDTKSQIEAVIGDYKARSYVNSQHMSFANSMFIRDSYKGAVKQDYTNLLKDKFNAEVILDSFTNANNINSWASDKTFKLVNNLVSDDSVKNADFFLLNALAIDMEWVNQIHCATGSKVDCLEPLYSIEYYHEKINEDDKLFYHDASYTYDDERWFYQLEFDGKSNTKASSVLADFNKYDIVKELGEENIRKTVEEEYRKYLESEEGKEAVDLGYIEADVNKFLDEYMEELKSNYGKSIFNTDFYLYEDTEVKVFAKDLKEYDGLTLQYVGIMPKEKELKTYIDDVKASDINSIISGLKEVKPENFKEGVATIIRGEIPLFKYDYELQLKEDLKKLGIVDAFDQNKANLSNMVSSSAYIFEAKHKANIEFSNDGIKAAAATQEGGAGNTFGGFDYLFLIPTEKIDLTFDKPYMYLIRDKVSGEVWFTGTVYEPISK